MYVVSMVVSIIIIVIVDDWSTVLLRFESRSFGSNRVHALTLYECLCISVVATTFMHLTKLVHV